MPDNWNDIREYRENKGISIESLSEKLRLTPERIRYLEKGDFQNADPVIIRLHLKNYAAHVGLDYQELLEISGLKRSKEQNPPESYSEKVLVKKTRSYKGRKKEPSKILIYGSIVVGVFLLIFILNKVFSGLDIRENLFEMTDQQRFALDHDTEESLDSLRFRPVIPQAGSQEQVIDITEDMEIFAELDLSLPFRVNIFPRKTISYRHEIQGTQPKEDFILKDNPQSLDFRRAGRMIFYNTEDTRFMLENNFFRDKHYSRVVIETNSGGQTRIFIKQTVDSDTLQ
jgi:transcriptional regulator with XRE-family HTH domain